MYRKTVLENGVRILSEKMDNVRSVSLGIWVDAGSRDEGETQNGISHFIEHMIFRGTENRSGLEIAKELDAIGGLSNAFTGKESTCFHARVLDKHLLQLADILSDIFLRSKFDTIDVERERQIIIQEIAMVEDTPEDSIHDMLNYKFWENHPIGLPILGTEENIAKFDRIAIQTYMKNFYVPERILVVAAGNINHDDLVEYFAKLFGSIEKNNSEYVRTTPVSQRGASVHFKEIEQVHVCLAGEAPSLRSRERFGAVVFNTVLGGNMSSKLFQEIRENKGLAYAVYSFLSLYIDSGLLGIYAATDQKKVNSVLEIIKNEILSISKGTLNKDDLIAAKEHIIGGIYLGSESADNRMMRNAKNELIFQKYIDYDELISELEKVSIDDVVESACNIFNNAKINFVALGPLQEDEIDRENIEYI